MAFDIGSRSWLAAGFLLATSTSMVLGAELATSWTSGTTQARARLVAGNAPVGSGHQGLMAAVEIELAPNWKTYWKFPGDAGGVPPFFDWSGSDNVRAVQVLYPAPSRIKDVTGDLLGYQGGVVFPVAVEPHDPAAPTTLRMKADYGVCLDICVPVSTELQLEIAPTARNELSARVAAALDLVPRPVAKLRPSDPRLVRSEVRQSGASPALVLEADFPAGTAGADAYVESPDGHYIPLANRARTVDLGNGRLRFEFDLTAAADIPQILGKSTTVTLVSERGASEAAFVLR